MTTIQFSNEAFSQITNFKTEQNYFGYSKHDNWSFGTEVNINGKNYKFQKKGFWKSGFLVYELENQELIADIEYDSWSWKGTILFDKKTYLIKKNSFWKPKYELFSNGEKLIKIEYYNQFWNVSGEINYVAEDSEKMKLLGVICHAVVDIQRRRAAAAAA